MAPRSNVSVENVCKKCTKEVKISVKCCICSATYHPSCILKIHGVYVNKGNITCCDDITSKKCDCERKDQQIEELKSRLSQLNEICFESSIRQYNSIEEGEIVLEVPNVEMSTGTEMIEPSDETEERNDSHEVKLLNALLSEKSTLIEELQDKIKLLKKYITLLEKTEEQTLVTPVIEKTGLAAEKTVGETPSLAPPVIETSYPTDALKLPANSNHQRQHEQPTVSTTKTRKVNENIMNVNKNKSKKILMTPINKSIVGTRQNLITDGEKTFSSAKRRVWIHIGKVEVNTSEEMIKSHLHKLFPNRLFVIEQQKISEGANSTSFKVGGDMDLMNELYNSENWPSGVTIRRFGFFRQNRQQNRK